MFKKIKKVFEEKGINMDFLNAPKIAAEVAHMENCWAMMPEVVKENRVFPDYVAEDIYKKISAAEQEEVTIINQAPWMHSLYMALSGGALERNALAYEVDDATAFRFMLYLAVAEHLTKD